MLIFDHILQGKKWLKMSNFGSNCLFILFICHKLYQIHRICFQLVPVGTTRHPGRGLIVAEEDEEKEEEEVVVLVSFFFS